MLINYKNTATERFIRYTQIDTQSNPFSDTQPSTEKQMHLSKILVQELLEMGVEDAHLDEFGYVYASIPSNSAKEVPTICFCYGEKCEANYSRKLSRTRFSSTG